MYENLPFLQGGGQLGALMLNTDWSTTTVGSPDCWPESLRSAVAISLNSGFPIAIYWGYDFTLLYNDAWSAIPGQKHPWALGKPGAQVWPELWEGLQPEFESVLQDGQSYRRPDAPLYMHRFGYTEECYFDYTLSPIVAADGSVGGVFNAVIETSYKVINDRRNSVRNAFLAQAHTSATIESACEKIKVIFDQSLMDIPGYGLFIQDGQDSTAIKAILSGGLTETQLLEISKLIEDKASLEVQTGNRLDNLATNMVNPIVSYWPEPVEEAFITPISAGEASIKGYLVLLASARKRIDEDYLTFFTAIAANTGTVLNNAASAELSVAYQNELQRNAQLASELTYNEERLRKMVMAAYFPLMILEGEDFLVSIANKPLAELWNKSLNEVTGRLLLDILPELKDQAFPELLRSVYSSGLPNRQDEVEVYFLTPEGRELKYVSYSYDPLFDPNGRVNAIVVSANDITAVVKTRQLLEESHEEQQALNEEVTASNEELIASNEELAAANEELAAANEELAVTNEELSETQEQLHHTLGKLGLSEQRFRNLIREATIGIILLSGPELTVQIVNKAYGDLIGRNTDELLGKSLFDIIPEAAGAFRKVIEPVMTTGRPVSLYDQYYFVNKDDTRIEGYLNLTYQPYRETDGEVTGVLVLCQDVTAQVRDQQLLEAGERRFQFMLNSIPQQVWTALPDGKLNYVNQVVAADFGRSAEEIIGQGWEAFVHPDDLPASILGWQEALESGKEYLAEFRLRFADGAYLWHLTRAVPFVEDGNITVWLGTNTNIELQKQNEQRKDEFLSIASHELKTPLTGIKAFNQLMKRHDPSRIGVYVEKSGENIQRLEKLINDLLDVTKINAGKLTYDLKPFDFSGMLADSVESVQLTSSTHQIILEKPDQLEYNGDRLRLEQVVTNFLTNAVKYSPDANQVQINCWVEEGGVFVSVRDFGIGIQDQHIQRLFDRYYRIDNTSMRFEGLGLGLFISAEILKRHMGTFWIESEPGEGSTFYFRLPLVQNEPVEVIKKSAQYYSDTHITISKSTTGDWLEVDWTGFQNVDSVKSGGMRMLELVKTTGAHKILNDNTNVVGSWSEASDWAGEVWFPMMEQAGLKYFAWVHSPSVFSKLSAEKSVDVKQGDTEVRFFSDAKVARDWLEHLAD
ncbi:two-component sensor histidine kinase [Pedobacter sp. BAL39]|uniref:PAS domain-containing sensor histidine kinase n=1 Tax=Pedobacter sp. BAL39 TaxID=391596 RepID=UPI0001559AF0|nr:PAS domain-containing protein [Pedobacter sp. BAL39]EDM36510.1 two-component sensor histidine kinase [Pedobacter sp. BAL39]